MKTLVVARTPEARDAILEVLKSRKVDSSATVSDSLENGIELIEQAQAGDIRLVIWDFESKSEILLKSLLEVTSSTPCILLLAKGRLTAELPNSEGREAILRLLPQGDYSALGKEVDRLIEDGLFSKGETPDEDFIRIATAGLDLQGKLEMDIFVKLAPNRYCRRFKKDDHFDVNDLEQNFRKRGIEAFYIEKGEVESVVDKKADQADALIQAPSADEEKARTAATENLALVHDIVQQLGFTPKIQELAKKTVSLLVKVLGGSPKLSAILTKMKKHDGKYIASHSVMLAEISCAMASRVGLNSATTFMKLGLAAFLHDLPFADNRLAQISSLEQINQTSLTPKQIQEIKNHPVKASEFARKFHQIPPDVDTIVLQHHERPDGSGFPRGLFANQLFPLSCLFIMAEDLLQFYLESPAAGETQMVLDAFLEQRTERYSGGAFRKLRESLESGTPLQL